MINEDINRPLEPIAGLALYGLLWPLFNEFVTAVLFSLGHDQNLGGALLRMLIEALSLLAGTISLAIFLFSRRKPHPPLRGKAIAAWVAAAILMSSAMFNVGWMRGGFFCEIGSCPHFN